MFDLLTFIYILIVVILAFCGYRFGLASGVVLQQELQNSIEMLRYQHDKLNTELQREQYYSKLLSEELEDTKRGQMWRDK